MPFLKIWKVIPLLWQHPISFGISKKSPAIFANVPLPVALAKIFIYQLSRRRLSTASPPPMLIRTYAIKSVWHIQKLIFSTFLRFRWIELELHQQQKRASASSARTLVDLTIQRRRSKEEETNVQFQSLTSSTDKILSELGLLMQQCETIEDEKCSEKRRRHLV